MNQKHDQCKYFGFKKCPHIEDDVMKRANQEMPRYYGGKIQQMLPVPTDEEINKICGICQMFTQK